MKHAAAVAAEERGMKELFDQAAGSPCPMWSYSTATQQAPFGAGFLSTLEVLSVAAPTTTLDWSWLFCVETESRLVPLEAALGDPVIIKKELGLVGLHCKH